MSPETFFPWNFFPQSRVIVGLWSEEKSCATWNGFGGHTSQKMELRSMFSVIATGLVSPFTYMCLIPSSPLLNSFINATEWERRRTSGFQSKHFAVLWVTGGCSPSMLWFTCSTVQSYNSTPTKRVDKGPAQFPRQFCGCCFSTRNKHKSAVNSMQLGPFPSDSFNFKTLPQR